MTIQKNNCKKTKKRKLTKSLTKNSQERKRKHFKKNTTQKKSKLNFNSSSSQKIIVQGARANNLKNVSVQFQKNKMTVVTGLSGSGKSSLVFDVIYAESSRRFLESLSAYARTMIGVNAKPDVDKIENLSPAIAIDQKSVGRSVRSTVGTMTEIYDYLRILFSSFGQPHCPKTGKALTKKSIEDIVADIFKVKTLTEIIILAPIDRDEDLVHSLKILRQEGFQRGRVAKKIISLNEIKSQSLNSKNIQVEIVIDSFIFDKKEIDREYVYDSIETAMKIGSGTCLVIFDKKREQFYSNDFYCQDSDFRLTECSPRNFSFNHPAGACSTCSGLGTQNKFSSELLVPNSNLSILEGAIHCWGNFNYQNKTSQIKIEELEKIAKKYKFSLNKPIKKLTKLQKNILFYGEKKSNSKNQLGQFQGIIAELEDKYNTIKSDRTRSELEKYMRKSICKDCHGKKLKPEYLAVLIDKKSIDDYGQLALTDFIKSIKQISQSISFKKSEKQIINQLVAEITQRTQALIDVGLGYLTLTRGSHTLSGGEAQRIRLAVQIKSDLTGIIYVLDEPTVGLHSQDTHKLIQTMRKLQAIGNTLLVVEHDAEVIKVADDIIDMGLGAGENGGNLIFQGDFKKLQKSNTLTSQYIQGKKKVYQKKSYRPGNGKFITIEKASENNLAEITVQFPLGTFNVVAGVSGSGKSTLINDILARALSQYFYRAKSIPGKHRAIKGLTNIKKVINITQAPIGKTPRSNAATYTGVFAPIRELFANTPQAKERGYSACQFSFNMKGGRCEVCHGDGSLKVEMHLLPDVYVKCEACQGTRYNQKTLNIKYQGVNIAEVLDMSVGYALDFFKGQTLITDKLATMQAVGLDYLKLGQSATTFSGGEAQRIKLATELARKSMGQTLYILDEPTVGLHFEDTKKLLQVLEMLVDKGNTVIVVEHNLDVIRQADWVLELGPVGGKDGGQVVFTGTPKELKKCKKSLTAKYL
jgi:excinuclease ABC subunit A